ncbi:succinate dehydrogenase membrane subunit sdhd1 [Rhodococcus gordoniae]|uniref:Succinate dehydrogenase membrane subunit sdhd1 n=1 Tax=Rhodococcus gordoniae TaxID=223392 RepID=A0A379LXX0_9NOCA|nr:MULTISPECIES: hypothetical protein [Rhodococcus]UTT47106.1 hypothetical protein NMQ04_12460 [Rhodococcus gordoniae]SUE14376.1 succinate dehydrogenase membrane subunit sdhd1 [Rhodococcus gordoniae]
MSTSEASPAARGTPATGVRSAGRARIAARTLRNDRWWQTPALTVLGLGVFVVYATIRSFVRSAYYVEDYHYLTPFYSPCVSASCVDGARHFGTWVGELPMWIPLAFLSLPLLLGFRLTCYYYRKAYYRSFWLSPPACAVAEPHRRYTGETRLPLILQNSHRYFFYAGFVVSLINTYDMIAAFRSPSGFGIGLGNLILLINVILLWGYTLSCHSCRHVTGGRLRHFSKHPVRYRIWTFLSRLNVRHMQFAWITLGTLILTDFYIMLVASETITDLRFVG